VIAAAVAYAATYSRFHPQPAPTPATASTPAPALASAAAALTADLAPLPATGGPMSWARLTPAQRVALAPFADQWDAFSDARKRKWLKIAARFPRMTPEQRRVARENYQVAKDLSAQARERAWNAYQQLPAEQKERLAAAERRRRPTVVSAPPTGKADRDISRLVNAHDRPGSATAPAQPTSNAAAAPVAASPAAVPPPAALPGTSSMFNGS